MEEWKNNSTLKMNMSQVRKKTCAFKHLLILTPWSIDATKQCK